MRVNLSTTFRSTWRIRNEHHCASFAVLPREEVLHTSLHDAALQHFKKPGRTRNEHPCASFAVLLREEVLLHTNIGEKNEHFNY